MCEFFDPPTQGDTISDIVVLQKSAHRQSTLKVSTGEWVLFRVFLHLCTHKTALQKSFDLCEIFKCTQLEFIISGPQTSKHTHMHVQCSQFGTNNRMGMLLQGVCPTPCVFTKLMELEEPTFPKQTLTS